MPLLMVENVERGPTVWGEHVWAPAGDQNGEDVLRLPDTLLEDPGFLGALSSGHLRVLDPPPEVADRIAALRLSPRATDRQGRAETAHQAVMATIERRQDRDMVAAACPGPGPRGAAGGCGTQVIRKAQEQAGPPLCATHAHLADQFMLVATPGQPAGWTRIPTH